MIATVDDNYNRFNLLNSFTSIISINFYRNIFDYSKIGESLIIFTENKCRHPHDRILHRQLMDVLRPNNIITFTKSNARASNRFIYDFGGSS